MKYLPFIWAALCRKPVEALLIWLATASAFTLFGLMVGLNVTTQRVIDSARMDRLIVLMRFPDSPFTGLPVALGKDLAGVEGVTGVGRFRWLSGYHRHPGNRVSIFAVDEGMRRAWSESPLTAAQWDRLFSTPQGIYISGKAAERLGLKEGDSFPVISERSERADGSNTWVFEVLGIVAEHTDWPGPYGYIVGNSSYVDNAAPLQKRGRGYSFWVALDDARRGQQVSQLIDRRFANSGTPTLSIPKKVDAQSMMNAMVGTAWTTRAVAGAGLFMILFLSVNAVARSVRERVPEFAVLQALGFRQVHITAMVFAEVAIPCVLGAALGTGLAVFVSKIPIGLLSGALANVLSRPTISPAVFVWAIGCGILLAIVGSAIPLTRLRKVSVTDTLAGR